MHVQRCCHTATLLPNGTVLIAGGFNGAYLASVELYDPATGQFTPTGSLTTARHDHIAVLLQNGTVLSAGGVGEGWSFLASAEIYTPATGRFTPTGSMMMPREAQTMTVLPDGRVLVAGGHQGRHAAITIYRSAELYDPATATFSATGNMSAKRHKHDAVLLANGRVLISGGSDERDDLGAYASTEQYDPAAGTFSASAAMPAPRYKHRGTSVVLRNGMVLIAGGAQHAVLYNPVTDRFDTVAGDLGPARFSRLFATATLLSSGDVLITGGYGLNQRTSAQAWLYRG
jgi:Galactose oxidase, central domain